MYINNNELDNAITSFEKYVQVQSDPYQKFQAINNILACAEKLNNHKKIVEYGFYAIENSDSLQYYHSLGKSLYLTNDSRLSSFIREANKKFPDDYRLRSLLEVVHNPDTDIIFN